MWEPLQLVSMAYWPIFFVTCLILHTTMFLLIYHRTSRLLTTLRFFLYPSNFVNATLATLAFATQVRNVNNTTSMALLCDGFCKLIGPSVCFLCYNGLLILVTVSGLINLHTLFYRTMCLKFYDLRQGDRRTFRFSWHYIIPLFTGVLSAIPTQNHDAVYNETLGLHPEYNLEPYRKFGGFADSHHICMTMNTFILAATTFYVPILGYFYRGTSLRILRSNRNAMSHGTRTMFEVLVQGLSLQVLLPLCCYVPVTILYIWNKYSGSQILISQYTLSILSTLPCIFDPLLQIYFIRPYRTTIRKFLSCQPLADLSPVRETEFETLFQIFMRFAGIRWGRRRISQVTVLVSTSGLLNLHTLCYRTMCFKYFEVSVANRKTMLFSMHYSIPVISAILQSIPAENHQFVNKETKLLHSEYNFAPYLNFGGLANTHHISTSLNVVFLALVAFYLPMMGAYWRRAENSEIQHCGGVGEESENVRSPHSVLKFPGLSFQIILPLVCYIPVGSLYMWNKYAGAQTLISQYTFTPLLTLPCIFDPLLQIYFIMPFRRTIHKMLTCRPQNTAISPNVSENQR